MGLSDVLGKIRNCRSAYHFEWLGWALATWSLPGLGFALFTVANLVPRAYSNRAWYMAKFPDYPKERKRVIPLIF
jgi:hypothetical protein